MAGVSPEHRHNTNQSEYFSEAQTFVLFSPKSNNGQVRNYRKFSRCTPVRVGMFIFGNL
jgi:hypothetical protein